MFIRKERFLWTWIAVPPGGSYVLRNDGYIFLPDNPRNSGVAITKRLAEWLGRRRCAKLMGKNTDMIFAYVVSGDGNIRLEDVKEIYRVIESEPIRHDTIDLNLKEVKEEYERGKEA